MSNILTEKTTAENFGATGLEMIEMNAARIQVDPVWWC